MNRGRFNVGQAWRLSPASVFQKSDTGGTPVLRKLAGTISLLAVTFRAVAADDVFIRANQVGYGTRDIKIAIAFSKSALPKAFSVLDANTQRIAFDGKSKPIASMTWGQFEHHVELNFTAFIKPGRYLLRLGESKSFPFTISAPAYAELPDQLLEFMRQQRCGYNPWLGTNCHQLDGRTAYGPLTNGTYVDARGGWHDAADLLKYLITSANATAQMLLAYQINTSSEGRVTRVPNLESKSEVRHSSESSRRRSEQVGMTRLPRSVNDGSDGIT